MPQTNFINLKTKIPSPGTKTLLNKIKKIEPLSMLNQIPIVWKKAEDFNIYDIKNNKFIDFTSSIFVSNIGHANKRMKRYLKDIINKDIFHTYTYANQIREKYVKKLVNFAGKNFNKAFLLSSGTEATEAGLKLMRLQGIKQKKRKLGVICFDGNWHGRTMGAQMMSGNKDQKKWIGYHDPNIHHLPFPYPWKLKNIDSDIFFEKSLKRLLNKKKLNLKKDICGFMIETFQGWGAFFYPKEYMQALAKVAKKHKILLCFDEMQSGFCRTGHNFGFKHYEVKPDLICCGKGMGNGFPLSGVIGNKKVLDLPGTGNMSSTHSSNPISCTAGLAVIDELQNNKKKFNILNKGKFFYNGLLNLKKKYKSIEYINGKGLIFGLVFSKQKIKNLKKVVMGCMKDGLLLVHTGRESIKLGPPLTISMKALSVSLKIIDNNLKKYL